MIPGPGRAPGSGAATGADLTLEAAVPLAYVLVLRAAADIGVRALAIKGPVLAAQGLREPRLSVDVDVLVDPATMPRLQAHLEELGWHDAGFYDTPSIMPLHSVNHRHERWPCEVDLHHWFPGFLADPQTVFDELWRRRVAVRVAGVDLDAPDPVAHAALAALHYLRDEASSVRWSAAGLDALAAVVAAWDDDVRADLVALSARVGAASTLRPLLDRLGLEPAEDDAVHAVPLAAWTMRSQSDERAVLPWLAELRSTPWHRRPRYLWWALWWGDQRFRTWDTSSPEARAALRRARVERVRRAARVLPTVLADYRRLGPDRSGKR